MRLTDTSSRRLSAHLSTAEASARGERYNGTFVYFQELRAVPERYLKRYRGRYQTESALVIGRKGKAMSELAHNQAAEAASQEEESLTPEEKLAAFLAKQEGNLWVKWYDMSNEERNEWRAELGSRERLLLWYEVHKHCRAYIAEHCEPSNPNGSGGKHNGSSPPENKEQTRLEEAWSRLSPEEQFTADYSDEDSSYDD